MANVARVVGALLQKRGKPRQGEPEYLPTVIKTEDLF